MDSDLESKYARLRGAAREQLRRLTSLELVLVSDIGGFEVLEWDSCQRQKHGVSLDDPLVGKRGADGIAHISDEEARLRIGPFVHAEKLRRRVEDAILTGSLRHFEKVDSDQFDEDYKVRPIDYLEWRDQLTELGPMPDVMRERLEELRNEHRRADSSEGKKPGNTAVNAQKRGELIGVARMILAYHRKESPSGFRKPDGTWNAEELAKFIDSSTDWLWPKREESTAKLDKPLSLSRMTFHLREWLRENSFPDKA